MFGAIKYLRWAALSALIAVVSTLFSFNSATATSVPTTIRIGYFANLTHTPALIAAQTGLWQKHLPGIKIEPFIFTGGSAAVEAFKGGALDISYMGPNPAIAGYNSTNGTLLRIVSGATYGGAQFVTRADIDTVGELRGKNFASPALGGTQDVALRTFLKSKGLVVLKDVIVSPTDNATTLSMFKNGQIDGAWVPEPWASRLVLEGKGRVFVDEKTLWVGEKFTTTNIVASTKFLAKYPTAVSAVIRANFEAIEFISAQPARAQQLAQAELLKQTGKGLPSQVLGRAWKNIGFSPDPLAATLKQNAAQAVKAGLLPLRNGGIKNIYDLTLLNAELKAKKLKTVSAAGNGKQ